MNKHLRLLTALVGLLLVSFFTWGTFSGGTSENGSTKPKAPFLSDSRPSQKQSITRPSAGLQSASEAVSPSASSPASPPTQPAQSPARGEPPLSEETIRQIEAILALKQSRSDTESKVDSKLLLANDLRLGFPTPGDAPLEIPELRRDPDGRILTDIKATVTDSLLAAIAGQGGVVVNHFAKHRAIRAWLPLSEVVSLAERPEVAFIMPAVHAVVRKSNTSAGDVAHKAAYARTAYAATGTGVKVGVLSDSVDYLSSVKASGDLPSSVTVLTGQAGNENGSQSGEGTAMLEIVYDLAPGSQLYFATAFTSAASFAENIRALHAAGCRVIIDDVGYMDQSPFQDDVIARAVNEVTAAGTLYFSSAGNEGNKNDGTSGTWEGDFVQGGTMTSGGSARPIHRFGTTLTYNVLSGTQGRADLFWADPLGASNNDYDLFIVNSSGSVVSSSTNRQTGSQDPYEYVDTVSNGGRIVVMKYSGVDRFIHLDTGGATLSVSTNGTTRGQSCAADAFCVAAVNTATASSGAFVGGSKNPVENFSSDGRRRMFFSPTGTPFTPGNFSSAGGILRNKPDLAAADGVACATTGFNPFFGTSAAAPHAGAIAALLRSYNTGLTASEYRNLLLNNCLDIEASGADPDSGNGIVMADKVLASAPSAQTPTITGFSPTSGAIGQSVVITGTKLTGATAVSFNNIAATAFTVNGTTQITATVPAGATTGTLKVITASGTATSLSAFTILSTPVISSLTPSSGNVGTSVVITGSFLTATSSVKFNGVSATAFTVNSATQITATVPAGAATGKVTITVSSLTATSPANFTVTTLPAIALLNPASGGAGSSVIITGSNFTGASAVRFNATPALYTVNSATQITATVPAAASTGAVSVTTPSGLATGPSFTVIPTPVITSFSPATAPAGTTVTITGTNLTGTSAVTFGGVASLSVSVLSATSVSAVVPTGAASGAIVLITPGGSATAPASFTFLAPPANDNFAAAQIISGASGSVNATNLAASKETGEPSHAGNIGGRSVWFRWTAPSNMTVRFSTAGSGFDTLLGVYTGSAVGSLNSVVSNDDSDGLTTSAVTWVATSGTNYFLAVDGRSSGAGSTAASGPVSLAWATTLTLPVVTSFSPAAGAVGATVILTGANFTGATAVEFNSTAATSFTVNSATQITATVPTGATSGAITVRTPGGAAVSPTTFTVQAVLGNDLFANAQILTGSSGTTPGNSASATKETGEPSHAGNSGGKSVWFRWTAPATATVEFHTANNSFDTLLGVYSGTAVGSLTTIASNDDALANNASQVTFNATVGTVYRIAVDGYGGVSGTFDLLWSSGSTTPTITSFTPTQGGPGTSVVVTGTNYLGATMVSFGGVAATAFTVNSGTQITATVPAGAVTGVVSVTTASGSVSSGSNFTVVSTPSNDAFASALALGSAPAALVGSNVNASKETGEPTHVGATPGKSVWFRWTAPATGSWLVSSSGSAFDTVLAVYTGSAVNALTLVASDDDNGDGNSSSLTLNTTVGTTYSIALDGYGGATGSYFLRVLPATTEQTLYYAGFETAEGFAASTLSGQQGWTTSGTGGNSVASGLFATGGRQARVGLTAPTDGSDALFVWKPLDHTPDLANRPVVRFSVDMAVIDSTNGLYDQFLWSVYNRDGVALFSLFFDNKSLDAGYYDSADTLITTGAFTNGIVYPLVVEMDFANNRWSATLNGTALATNVTMAATGSALNLGDVDAVWSIVGTTPGNNYLAFDNYTVSTLSDGRPNIVLEPLGVTLAPGGSTTLTVGAVGNEPLTYQWRLNGQNLSGQTAATLALTGLQTSGDYSVVVTNSAGTDTSAVATVNVVSPSAFGTWAASAFPGVTDTAITGGSADPDHDGLTNFAEFAFGSPATSPTASPGLPRVKAGETVLTFWRRTGSGAPVYELQTSPNLASWSVSSATAVVVTDPAAPSGYERVEVTLTASSQTFVRLMVRE